MKLDFYKMHGIGNDYIYVDCVKNDVSLTQSQIVFLSDRHKGVGGDGVIFVRRSAAADGRMEMYNADGSRATMCGNGIRCVGKLLFDLGYAKKDVIRVETDSGIKTLSMKLMGGRAVGCSVEMGKASFACADIPVTLDDAECVDKRISIAGGEYAVTCVSMGNPHCVVQVDDVDDFDVDKVGRLFESDPLFPDRVNAEFIRIEQRNAVNMRVYERGSGETMACGTGACAAVAAACRMGLCDRDVPVRVKLRGGELFVVFRNDDTVSMTGEATLVFKGEIELQ